jgi:hypothetical protein
MASTSVVAGEMPQHASGPPFAALWHLLLESLPHAALTTARWTDTVVCNPSHRVGRSQLSACHKSNQPGLMAETERVSYDPLFFAHYSFYAHDPRGLIDTKKPEFELCRTRLPAPYRGKLGDVARAVFMDHDQGNRST